MIPTFKDHPRFDTRNPKPCIVKTHKKNYLCIPTGFVNVSPVGATAPIIGVKHTVRCCHPDGRVIMRVRMSKKQRLAIRRQLEGVLP